MFVNGEPSKRLRSSTTYSGSFYPPVKRLRTTPDQPGSTVDLHRARIFFLRSRALTKRELGLEQSLRKFAILNRLRIFGWSIPQPKAVSIIPQPAAGIDEIVAIRLTSSKLCLPRSPLGLTDYEEPDQWNADDDQFDFGHPGGPELDDEDVFYTDFNFLDAEEESSTDDEYLDSPFSIIPTRRKPQKAFRQQDRTIRDCRIVTCERNPGAICCR